jgi:hypothetical protein
MHLQRKIKEFPFYIFLFPLFFVFHGFNTNFPFVSVSSALLLIGVYILWSLLFAGVFYFFSRRWRYAAFLAVFIMAFDFFFGNIQDTIKDNISFEPASKYSFLTIVFLVLLIILFFLLRKKQLFRLTFYLNTVFIVLVVIEIFSLLSASIFKPKASIDSLPGFTKICDSCKKPDIYIILLDGYAGSQQLKDLFDYDNSPFTDSLAQRGFITIKKSHSNYNSSPSSVASLLNMEYLDSNEVNHMRQNGHMHAFARINNNRLMSFLQANGYSVFNYSIFKVAGQSSPTGGSFVPANAKLVNGNTFISRLEKDVFLSLANRLHLNKYVKEILYAANRDNEKLYNLTMENAAMKLNKPKIIYTHLLMPHHPYYYEENGTARPFEEVNNMPLSDKPAYLSYLKYTNKKILRLVDHILTNSPAPPVITVLSDHGFRYFENAHYIYNFSDILSIHLPQKNYALFKDSMTNVNFLSTFLNSSFQQQLPMQKDTSIFVNF